MQEFNISYTYAKADGTSRTQTTQKVKAESISAAKLLSRSMLLKGRLSFNGDKLMCCRG